MNYEAIAEDEDFERYVALSKELQRVDFTLCTREEKIALFVNVYNALVIHATVKAGAPTNMWLRWKFFNTFHYLIGPHLYSLHAIENGVLRANRKGVGKMWRPFAKNDERLKVVAIGLKILTVTFISFYYTIFCAFSATKTDAKNGKLTLKIL